MQKENKKCIAHKNAKTGGHWAVLPSLAKSQHCGWQIPVPHTQFDRPVSKRPVFRTEEPCSTHWLFLLSFTLHLTWKCSTRICLFPYHISLPSLIQKHNNFFTRGFVQIVHTGVLSVSSCSLYIGAPTHTWIWGLTTELCTPFSSQLLRQECLEQPSTNAYKRRRWHPLMAHPFKPIHMHYKISQVTSTMYHTLCDTEKLLSDCCKKKWTGNKRQSHLSCEWGGEESCLPEYRGCWKGDAFPPAH